MAAEKKEVHCHLICQVWLIKDPIFDRVYLNCGGALDAIEEIVAEWESFGVKFSQVSETDFREYECRLPVLGRITLCVQPCDEELAQCTEGTKPFYPEHRRRGAYHYHFSILLRGRKPRVLDVPYRSFRDAMARAMLEAHKFDIIGFPLVRVGARIWKVDLPIGSLSLCVMPCADSDCKPLPASISIPKIVESVQASIGWIGDFLGTAEEFRNIQELEMALLSLEAALEDGDGNV